MIGCLALSQEQRFPKSSKFTDSIVFHGRWENNTLSEATNLRERGHRLRERTKQRMKQVSEKFRGEMEEVEMIQGIVRMRQRRLAQANLRACCAIMVQITWRRHRARIVVRERRGKILGRILLRSWRSFKTRRSLAVIKRFVVSRIHERAELARQRSEAAARVQRVWKHRVARDGVRQVVMASAAIEVVIVNTLADLAETVYLDTKADVISRVWRRLRLRPGSKNRKAPRGRVFLTQGGASSPRRKPRPPSPRGGLPSDPSMSPRGGSNSRGKSNNTSPSLGAWRGVVAAASSAATTATAATASPSTATGTVPTTVDDAVPTGCSSATVTSSEQNQQQKYVLPPPARPVLRRSWASSFENATNCRASRGGSSAGLPRKLSRRGDDVASSPHTALLTAAAGADTAHIADVAGSRDELGQSTFKAPAVGNDSALAGISSSRTPPGQCDVIVRPPYDNFVSGVDCAGVRSGGGVAAVRDDSISSYMSDSATKNPSLPGEGVTGGVEEQAAGAATTIQPRRPSDVRRSKLLEDRPSASTIGEQGIQEDTSVHRAIENDAVIRALAVDDDAAVHVPISDTGVGGRSAGSQPLRKAEGVPAVDDVSAMVATETESVAVPLPEADGRNTANGSSRDGAFGDRVMVPASFGRLEAGVNATTVAVAPDCRVEEESSCNRRQGSLSTEPWPESSPIEEYASDLFESDSHISLPP